MKKILVAAAACGLASWAVAAGSSRLNKEEESIAWTLTAASHCPPTDRDGRWLEGTCVQLVTKTAATLIRSFVPDSNEVVKGLLDVVRCERGAKSAGGTPPFLAQCVSRKSQEAAHSLAKWRELRAKSPDLPNEVPDAPLPKGNSLFPDK